MHILAATLLFASGLSSLIVQVVLVRQLSLLLGSTVESTALGTAAFVGALGAGATVGGRIADRMTNAFRGYGAVELAVGVLTLVLMALLPAIEPLAAAVTWFQPGREGWQWLSWPSRGLHLLLASALVTPPALLMGATVPLVLRCLGASATQARRHLGWLFAANTAGAALGALLTDLCLIPVLGIRGSLGVAAATSMVVGSVALSHRNTGSAAGPSAARSPRHLGMAMACTGWTAMGLEVAWFQYLSSTLGQYRAVFSILLAVMLACLALGAALAGRLTHTPRRAFALTQAAVAVTGGLCLLLLSPRSLIELQLALRESFADGSALWRIALQHLVTLRFTATVVALPALFMGMAYPLVNAIAQQTDGAVGRVSGGLAGWTALGNIGGALTTGFVLVPLLGLQHTVAVLMLFSLVAIGLVSPRRWAIPGAGAAGATALGFWLLPAHTLLWKSFPHGRASSEGVLAVHEGPRGTLVVTGQPNRAARLWTNGHPMSSSTPHAQRYMRLMAHLPLLMQDDPDRALVICFGVGNTASAAATHPLSGLDVVDLDPDILRSAGWFEHANRGVLDDERVTVTVTDGRLFLRTTDHRYDLITLEPPPIGYAGVSNLYSRQFYELARSRLTDTGAISQWLPAYQVPEDTVRSALRSFVEVFPNSIVVVAAGRELVLVGSPAPIRLDPAHTIPAAVRKDLAAVGITGIVDLAAVVAATGPTLQAASQSQPAITDDWPRLELSQASHVMENRLPADLFDVEAALAVCPDCRGHPRLRAQLSVLGALYRSEQFLAFSNYLDGRSTSGFAAEDAWLPAIEDSPSLQTMFREATR